MPFSENDFLNLKSLITSLPPLDRADKATFERLRSGAIIELFNPYVNNEGILFGRYRTPYSGHSYENTSVGKIPAHSISLRSFHYMLYLSKTGKIYVGSQYLGQFGGYGYLLPQIKRLVNASNISSKTVFDLSLFSGKFTIKEIRATIHRKSEDIFTTTNPLKDRRVTVIQRSPNNANRFDEVAKSSFLSNIKKTFDLRKKSIESALADLSILDLDSELLEDCILVVDMGKGKQRTIPLFDKDPMALRFPVECELDSEGHPDVTQIRAAMLTVLEGILEKTGV